MATMSWQISYSGRRKKSEESSALLALGTALFPPVLCLKYLFEYQRNVERGTWNVERGTWNVERGTWNVERGTWNVERGTWNVERDPMRAGHVIRKENSIII